MNPLLLVLLIIGGIVLSCTLLIILVCHKFDKIHKELEDLKDLEGDDDEDVL